ncbi:ATP-dependent DNA ligase [Sphingomonas cannabina]|uniref:ATP-dependent DNA ligase n=1 Tax=Sphingomonas cannabina TaxID=2899123 RepID=UPI001F36AD99|nr:ATP-dependent DNA ligase [Sphingomonas cannabina]UIJ45661.1 ATP-dependent DNA ligase [Sphingomonas cannabina]
MTAPIVPMEAKLAAELPSDEGWQFEPKWDGFRCIALRDGDRVELWSKAGKPLGRYFPEVVAALAALPAKRFRLDGELIVPVGGSLSFAALQMRLHPSARRVAKLAAETPAELMLFDDLADPAAPLTQRRATLEVFVRANPSPALHLSPATRDPARAREWLAETGGALDGVVAKRLDEPYRPGERAMVKVKRLRTADCVVGGFRYATGKPVVGSLLLGLYDKEGRLDHVGFTSNMPDRAPLTKQLEKRIVPPGFTGDAPGGPSRWSTERSAEWQPLRPELVVEVRYDHVTGQRFRHGTAFLRWRPDKAPRQCTLDQLEPEASPAVVGAALAG